MGSSEVKVGAFTLGGAAILAGIITFMGALLLVMMATNCKLIILK